MLGVAPEHTADFLVGLFTAVSRLETFPALGQQVTKNPRYRQILFENYRIIYTLDDDVASIAVISHVAQDIDAKLEATN